MKSAPKTRIEIQNCGDTIGPIVKHLRKYWDGVNNVRPKGYKEFCKDYCDFDGMIEWDEHEREQLENEFQGFDTDGTTDFNFVKTVSLPQVAYDANCQGRPPFEVLVWACVSYGMMLGKVLHQEKIAENERWRLASKLLKLSTDLMPAIDEERKDNEPLPT